MRTAGCECRGVHCLRCFKRALSSNLSFTGIFVLLTFVICSHVLKGTYLRQVFTQKRLWNITALFHAFRCRSEAPGIMASPPAQRWAGSVQETGGAPGIIWRPGWGWFQGAQGRVVQGGVRGRPAQQREGNVHEQTAAERQGAGRVTRLGPATRCRPVQEKQGLACCCSCATQGGRSLRPEPGTCVASAPCRLPGRLSVPNSLTPWREHGQRVQPGSGRQDLDDVGVGS